MFMYTYKENLASKMTHGDKLLSKGRVFRIISPATCVIPVLHESHAYVSRY